MGFLMMMMMKKEEYMMVAPLQIQMQAVRAPIRHFRHVRQSANAKAKWFIQGSLSNACV